MCKSKSLIRAKDLKAGDVVWGAKTIAVHRKIVSVTRDRIYSEQDYDVRVTFDDGSDVIYDSDMIVSAPITSDDDEVNDG